MMCNGVFPLLWLQQTVRANKKRLHAGLGEKEGFVYFWYGAVNQGERRQADLLADGALSLSSITIFAFSIMLLPYSRAFNRIALDRNVPMLRF